jgi:hypothetical protein
MRRSARCEPVQRRSRVTSLPGAFPLLGHNEGRSSRCDVTGSGHGRTVQWPGCADHRCQRRHGQALACRLAAEALAAQAGGWSTDKSEAGTKPVQVRRELAWMLPMHAILYIHGT